MYIYTILFCFLSEMHIVLAVRLSLITQTSQTSYQAPAMVLPPPTGQM